MTPPILDFENFYFLVDIDITSTLNVVILECTFNSQIVIRCQIEMPSGELSTNQFHPNYDSH